MSQKYALFIGRWQPFHLGHDYIIRKKLDEGKAVVIACRDTPVSEFDPYTLEERIEMISEHYKDEDVVVVPIPDIESVNIGRKVGYEVNRFDAPEDIEGISATEIRRRKADGDDSWMDLVPDAIAEYLNSPINKEGIVIWFTGLSGAGKSTIAEALKPELESKGYRVKVLDGDEVRTNLTCDLGFSKVDRDENIKRISFVAKSVADVGGIAIVAAISPYTEARRQARALVGEERFIEVFVNPGVTECIRRDTKGLYEKAVSGEILNFTGISDPYEDPEIPELILDTKEESVEESLRVIISFLSHRLFLR